MVNYKIVNTGKIVNVGGGFSEMGGDILETKTDQIVVKSMRMSKAKEMVRHLNFGGGFDGSTPAFFLAERKKVLELTNELV
jgi:predicted metal-dependent peptidase